MDYLIDSAEVNLIKEIIEYYPIAGVTTNPSLILQVKKPLKEVVQEIRDCIGYERMLHVQILSSEESKIIEDAITLNELVKGDFYAKIPVTMDGIKAMQELKRMGIKVTATAIFTEQQALLAAKSGADYVAPYVNRLDNISTDGTKVVQEITKLLRCYDFPTKVLAASFKNVEQVHRVSLGGVSSVTLAPELYKKLLYHPLTDISINDFLRDGEHYYDL